MREIVEEVTRTLPTTPTAAEIDAVVQQEEQYFIADLARAAPIGPSLELIRRFQGRVRIALVTGSSLDVARAALKHLDLEAAFATIVSSNDGFPSKPAPDALIAAACQLRLSPAQCLVIEDSTAGFSAAQAAQMRCLDVNALRQLIRPPNGLRKQAWEH